PPLLRFFLTAPAAPDIYTLSLHDALPISARASIPHVIARRGVVLFISSIGADMTGPGGAPYYVAKAGVNALMKVLAKEVASDGVDRKSTRLNSSHVAISYAVFCLKKKTQR